MCRARHFGATKESVHKSDLVVFCETQQKFSVFIDHVSAICAQHLVACFLAPLASLPCSGVCVFKTKTTQAGTDATVLLRAAMYLAFCPSGASSGGA